MGVVLVYIPFNKLSKLQSCMAYIFVGPFQIVEIKLWKMTIVEKLDLV